MSEAGFSGSKTASIVGITYRQLDYWTRTGLVRPSLGDATGSGSRREYAYQDLLELRLIKTLLDAGIKLEAVREVFRYLREQLITDIASAHIVIDGNSVNFCVGDEWIDLVKNGQGVLHTLVGANVKREIDLSIGELRPADVPVQAAV